MIADVMASHQLVGLDAAGTLCSCGVSSLDHLEHLGEIALELMGDSATARRSRSRSTSEKVGSSAWDVMQSRADNLASFRNMTEVWFPELKRRRGPRYRFTLTQLAIADLAVAKLQAHAREQEAA